MKLKHFTIGALAAAIAVIGKALGMGIDAVTWMLVRACGLDWGRAAAQAPVVLWTVVCSLGALSLWALFNIEEERSRKRLRKAHRSHARTPEYPALPEHTEKGA